MKNILKSIVLVAKEAGRSFKEYPAALASALLFTLVTLIRIYVDWPAQEAYNFLINSLHLALGLGAAFSLTAIAFAKVKLNSKKAFFTANLVSALVVVGAFLALYFLGGVKDPTGKYYYLAEIAVTRLLVASFISILAFILVGAYHKDQAENQAGFGRSFFIFHKAFFIALLYEAVMYLGASAVAGSIRVLLYRNMSEKVFMYIGALTAFLAYSIFVSHFPDFAKRAEEGSYEDRGQPRFIQVLFDYIMVPLTLALTGVLLLWSIKTVVGQEEVSFLVLSGVAAGYALVGLWLYIMVSHSQAKTSIFYRKTYPFTALIILAFEARALLIQLAKWGPKITEYWFSIMWIVSVVAALVLLMVMVRLIKMDKAYLAIVLTVILALTVGVLPGLGYKDLTVKIQGDRLENILNQEGMLSADNIVPGPADLDVETKELITDAVYFLEGADQAKLPVWFGDGLSNYNVFQEKFGFEPMWPDEDNSGGSYEGIYLFLDGGNADIKDYLWAIRPTIDGTRQTAYLETDRGLYSFAYTISTVNKAPVLNVELDGKVILQASMENHFEKLQGKYSTKDRQSKETSFEDMSFKVENQDIKLLLVFSYVSINTNTSNGRVDYYTEINTIYMKEE